MRRISRRPLDPPRHFVPSSVEFVEAVRLGLGWGMVPDLQGEGLLTSGELVEIDERSTIDVPLYWQRWSLPSPALDALTDAVVEAAGAVLR